MTLPPLTIIPAGAGSGKTYTIQKTLADWVVSGQVRPDRIVAVTFTEAASAEMRDRIRSELTAQGRLEDALLLEQSYISTIHAFGLRLLTEFAFDCGLSPSPRLLNNTEEETLMRRALTATDLADEIMIDLSRYGYTYDFSSGKGAEDLFRDAVLQLISKLRSIGRQEEDSLLLSHAERMVTELYGETGNAESLEKSLARAAQNLLERFPIDMTALYGDNDTAVRALRQNYRDLKQAEKGESLASDWKLWQRLRKLRTIGVPDEYLALAEAVMQAADALPKHPGPLSDALTHVRALLGSSMETLSFHAEKKREKGLLDYTDMLAISHRMFTENSSVREILKERIDCLIIDEFQDTNPLQFSLLWQFQSMGVPTLVVGDLKQAIMGFQNADHRLLKALQEMHPEESFPLTSNWRSVPPLMSWINCMGTGLFGDQYTQLEAKADFPSSMAPLEAILFKKRPRKNSLQVRETTLRIKEILTSGNEVVYDRSSGKQRPIRGGDIALLCPTNARLDLFAEELRKQGIRSRIAQVGWFESRIIQLLYYTLSYVVDPADRHAALYLTVTELGEHSLESALKHLIAGRLPDDPILTALQPIIDGAQDRDVSTLLNEVIDGLCLYDKINLWPDGKQARANLLRLEHEALQFQATEPAALTGGGYYGFGLKTFLAWLKEKSEQDEHNQQPDAMVNDEDAVELVTWHRSKGREWPVVVVAALEKSVEARLPSFDVVYDDFSDLDTILEHARIEISPSFAAPESNEQFSQSLMPETYTGAYRLLYVALTRSREKLIIEWPEYLLKSKAKAKTFWSLLTAKAEMSLVGTKLKTGETAFDCRVFAADVEEHDEESATEESPLQRKEFGQIKIDRAESPRYLTPDSVTPSSLHDGDEAASVSGKLQTYHYSEALQVTIDLHASDRGTLLHRCFEIDIKNALAYDKAAKILDYPLNADQWDEIQATVSAFEKSLQELFSPVAVARELPVLFKNEQGSVVSGIMDLLVESSAGFWIVDHKSDVADEYEERFATYLPQLLCYADAVGKARCDKPVLGIAINWITPGMLMTKSLQSNDNLREA